MICSWLHIYDDLMSHHEPSWASNVILLIYVRDCRHRFARRRKIWTKNTLLYSYKIRMNYFWTTLHRHPKNTYEQAQPIRQDVSAHTLAQICTHCTQINAGFHWCTISHMYDQHGHTDNHMFQRMQDLLHTWPTQAHWWSHIFTNARFPTCTTNTGTLTITHFH